MTTLYRHAPTHGPDGVRTSDLYAESELGAVAFRVPKAHAAHLVTAANVHALLVTALDQIAKTTREPETARLAGMALYEVGRTARQAEYRYELSRG